MYHHLYYVLIIICVKISVGYVPEEDFQKISNPKIGPKGMPYGKTTSCQTFGKYARFNPHSIVGEKWIVFYYWALPRPIEVYEFWIPSKKDMQYIHHAFDGHLSARFNWSATLVLMTDLTSNLTTLLQELGDRGQYYAYPVIRNIPEGKKAEYYEIRIRQTGDNKYLGLMNCKRQMAFIMARFKDIPPQKRLQEEASKLGYRGRKGKSYLYQGHDWMPIPEMDEKAFWRINKEFTKRFNLI